MLGDLEYAFFEEGLKLPVNVASNLEEDHKKKLLKVLSDHKRTIAWKFSNIKRISTPLRTHKIQMEESFIPMIQPQRSLNLNMNQVVKGEVIKLVNAKIFTQLF